MPVLAIGAVDLVALVIAAAVLLVLLAAWVPFKLIDLVLSHLWFVGNYVSGTVSGWLESAMKAVIRTFDSFTHAVAHLIWQGAIGIWHLLEQTVNAILDAKVWAMRAWHLANTGVAGLTATILGYYNRAIAWATHEAAVAIGVAAADLAVAEHDIALARNYAVGVAEGLYNQAVAVAAADLTTAIHIVEGYHRYDVALAESLYNQAITYAQDLFNPAIAELSTLVRTIPADIAQAVTTAEGYVNQVVPADVAAAVAGILAGVLPRIAVLEAEAVRCLEPLCNSVTPNASQLGKLGSLFTHLESDAFLVLVLAFLGDVALHPDVVVNEAEAVLGGLAHSTLAAYRNLVGV
jgi:hypothetical protein